MAAAQALIAQARPTTVRIHHGFPGYAAHRDCAVFCHR